MKRIERRFYTLSIVLFIACGAFLLISLIKYVAYNRYVGSDAYSFIIRGTHFTGFAVYAVGCGLGGLISRCTGAIIATLSGERPDPTHKEETADEPPKNPKSINKVNTEGYETTPGYD